MSIEVVNESGFDGVNEEELIDVATFVLGEMDVHPDAEATISVVDVATMSDLHVRWMDLEGPTDVMSFPMDELRPGTADHPTPPGMLGDICICPQVAVFIHIPFRHICVRIQAITDVPGFNHLISLRPTIPEPKITNNKNRL